MKPSKVGTVALVIGFKKETPVLLESISDDREITALQEAVESGEKEPLQSIYALRDKQAKEDDDFGNYVEELLSQPFVRPEIQEHGLQWLRSKIRIEQYQRSESEATRVIAQYAFKVYQDNPRQTEFILAGPVAKVKIRIFTLKEARAQGPAADNAA